MSSIGTTSVIRHAFQGLDAETVKDLRQVSQRKEYPAGTVLCKQGEIEHTFYVIVDGRVIVSRVVGDEEQILNTLGPNGYFGEMGLIDDSPRMANCTTLISTTVLEMTEQEFDRLMVESPGLANALIQKILSNSRLMDQRYIADLQKKNLALQKAYDDLRAAQAELVEKERLEREVELAVSVQRNLLPNELPQFDDFAFAAYLAPAWQVGGDFYNVIELDEAHVGVLIADVADKGFHAALFMAVTRTLFQQAAHHTLSPAQVAEEVHRSMFEVTNTDDIFLTAFYGVLHRPSRVLTYVRAGHDRPVLYRDGVVTELEGDGRILGMMFELDLEEYSVQLQPGDRLVMFSDGVPDATNWNDEQYDINRLQEVVRENGHLAAEALIEVIAQDVEAWCAGAPAADDLTLLILEAIR